jgi:predicted O-linked N-acetylglucosamine transferase (SPINDLY family)
VTGARGNLVRRSWRQAIARTPESAPAYLSLAKLVAAGDALTALGRAYALAGTAPEVARAYAHGASAAGDAARCRAVLRAAVAREARPETLVDLAVVEGRLGLGVAATHLRRALALAPDLAAAHAALGNRGDAAEVRFLRALAIEPRHGGALVNLANLWRDGARLDDSLTLLRRAASLLPADPVTLYNLANTRHIAGEAEAAARGYRAALALEARDGWRAREAMLLPPIPASIDEIRRWRARFVGRVARLAASPLRIDDPLSEGHWTSFHLAYHDEDDRPLQEAVARLWRHACPALARTDLRAHDGRPRLGFLSAYLRDHTIGHLFRGVIGAIDREKFRTVVLHVGEAKDAVARSIAAAADENVTLPEHLGEARRTIAGLRLDALLYPDIGMDPATYYLAHARLAPLQMVAWGHPVTTGLDSIDLFVSAETFDRDGAEADYTEGLARLPFLLLDWQPQQVELGAMERSRLGLARGRRAYFCAQSLFKLHPRMDAVFAEILRRDPEAVLHFVEGHRRPWCRLIEARLERQFPGAGRRIRFLPRLSGADFIRAQAFADVVLDTPGFSGGKTSLEAFAVGQPVVTMPSRYLRGRLTHGFYRRMGLDDLIATSLEAYVDLALRLGTDAVFRADSQARISDGAKRLWGTVESVRAFEALVLGGLSRRAARPS